MTEYLLFFLINIIGSFFFGESKQGSIELYWALIIGCFTLFFLLFEKKRVSNITKKVFLIIISIIITLLLSTYTSLNLAYSLSILIRYVAAIDIFYCCYTLPKQKNVHSFFATGLVVIGVIVACLSLIDRVVQTNTMTLPVMNLIFSRTGHNQAVYFLITLFPIIFWWKKQRPTILRITISNILFPLAIALCFSRGALILLSMYLIFLFLSLPKTNKKWGIILLFCCSIICICTLIVIPLLPNTIQTSLNTAPFFNHQFVKTTLTHEARFSNWNEAVIGFIHYPLFGTGPGTYILTSMRFHQTLIDAAGSAHSFFLQTLSELGLIGSIPIFLTIFFVCKTLWRIRKKTDPHAWATMGLIDSVFITFAYSVIEYNLDYFSLWIILWAIVGLLVSQNTTNKVRIQKFSIVLLSIFLLCFAGITVIGMHLQKNANTYTLGYYFRVTNVDKTERFIDYKNTIKQPFTPFEIHLITLLHKNQPDITIELANATNILSPTDREQWYFRSMDENKLNVYYAVSYMKFLYTQQRMDDFAKQYAKFIDIAYQLNTIPPQQTINFQDKKWIPYYQKPEFLSLFDGDASWTEMASKSLYFLGLWQMTTDTSSMREMWSMAKTLSPDWSYFYLELGAMYWHIFGHLLPMQMVFLQCQQRPLLQDTCPKNTITFMNLTSPGFHQDEIRKIPQR